MPRLMQAERPAPADAAPLAHHIGQEVATGAHVTAVRFVSGAMAAALGDGTVRFWEPGLAEPDSIVAHAGAILAVAAHADAGTILTGGDDGLVCRVGLSGVHPVAETGGKWVDAVAAAPWGAIAWSAGKAVTVIRSDGTRREIDMVSTVQGLAFAPRGRSLAIAHYGGVTLADLRARPSADRLMAWMGSHVAVSFSPNGRHVVSAMNENVLHGWRIDDGADMRMSGYPSKPKSLSWSPGGAWLATSGADCAVLWPFGGKEGPMGKQATPIAFAQALVTAVSCHPVSDAVAVGYADGAVVFARRGDDAVIPVRAPDGDRVSDLGFDAGGHLFGYGTEGGRLGLLDLRGIGQ
ncbi:WD40 repeat domain-containing protein [Aurantimonas aggregata]|uniref:WD40 repeat domain-containing protein n=1 Tax=Aurantimonas aggregata TaxID=2047720 RepID=A0A6L9MP24_9HYPH|nr:WD40 repeat domain-containing protein [Aurantimonas aggregata]NDV89270.1 WD40 repeat domain-containing protein [Aurantimonas aggregata]